MPLLMSRDNPDGWKLQELMAELQAEMKEKTDYLRGQLLEPQGKKKSEVMTDVLHNNLHIIRLMDQIKYLQQDSMRRLDTLGKNQGPRGTPRV